MLQMSQNLFLANTSDVIYSNAHFLTKRDFWFHQNDDLPETGCIFAPLLWSVVAYFVLFQCAVSGLLTLSAWTGLSVAPLATDASRFCASFMSVASVLKSTKGIRSERIDVVSAPDDCVTWSTDCDDCPVESVIPLTWHDTTLSCRRHAFVVSSKAKSSGQLNKCATPPEHQMNRWQSAGSG